MAQRTIHYLLGEMISTQIALADKQRFLLGSIMPDAIEACDRDKSHFRVRTDTRVYYDFEAYRNQYFDLMLRDELYLGYYIHLVEDAFYRTFIYQDCFTMPRSQEEVKLLHNDYHILNSYIVDKYKIQNILGTNMVLAQEPIGNIADFLLPKLLRDLEADFSERTEGAAVFLTERILDDFIETYAPLVVDEVRNLKNGTSTLKVCDYTWARRG